MTEPLLTIGIPHLDRSEMLQKALDSCFAQTLPVKIIVADQGGSDKTAAIMGRYEDHPHVRHLVTRGKVGCLWENWRAAAEACETDYFAFLQDDDTIARVFANRVVKAFEAYPKALHWQGNCHCTSDGLRAVKWGWNGPAVPVRMMDMIPEMWPGGILLAPMYLMSFALSPGVAFRNTEEFRLTLAGMPTHCDLFNERLIVAAMGCQGAWIADPVTAGYWVHHGDNESYRQNADGSQARQRTIMIEHLDDLLDRYGDWQTPFFSWLRMRSPVEIVGWVNTWENRESRHSDALIKVMAESIRDRVEVVAAPPGQDDSTVVYDEDEPVAA